MHAKIPAYARVYNALKARILESDYAASGFRGLRAHLPYPKLLFGRETRLRRPLQHHRRQV